MTEFNLITTPSMFSKALDGSVWYRVCGSWCGNGGPEDSHITGSVHKRKTAAFFEDTAAFQVKEMDSKWHQERPPIPREPEAPAVQGLPSRSSVPSDGSAHSFNAARNAALPPAPVQPAIPRPQQGDSSVVMGMQLLLQMQIQVNSMEARIRRLEEQAVRQMMAPRERAVRRRYSRSRSRSRSPVQRRLHGLEFFPSRR